MEITFPGPVFFAPEDEDRFFGWLYALPGYESVTGAGQELTLRLGNEREGAVDQLLVIFRRWHIDVRPLEAWRHEASFDSVLWTKPLHLAIAACRT